MMASLSILTVFVGILLSMFSVMSSQLILASALPAISAELSGASLYSWVFSGYMIASIVSIPLSSKLADIYGKRKFFMLGIALFGIGSIVGAVAPSMGFLLFGRVIQGCAAGMITPIALAMISDMLPPHKRGRMVAMLSMVQLGANIISPLLGSFIISNLSWQYTFYFSITLICMSFVVLLCGKKSVEKKVDIKLREIDILGSLLFGIVASLIVYFFNIFFVDYKITWPILILCSVIIVSSIVLYRVEKTHSSPVIKMEFFKNKVLRSSIVSSMIAGSMMYGLVTLLPLLTELLLELNLLQSHSAILLTFMLGNTVGLLTASIIWTKTKNLPTKAWAALIVSIGLSLAAIYSSNMPLFHLSNLATGIFLGIIMATVLIYSQNSVSSADRTVLSGIIQLSRCFGAAVGVAILIAVLAPITEIGNFMDFKSGYFTLGLFGLFGMLNESL